MKKFILTILFLITPLTLANANSLASLTSALVPTFKTPVAGQAPAKNQFNNTPVINKESFIFQLSVKTKSKHEVVAHWKIADGNYLYRNKFKISVAKNAKAKLGKINIPQSTVIRNDPFYGKVKIFRNQVSIPVPVKVSKTGKIQLFVHYQGCSDAGICYAPTTQLVMANVNKPGSVSVGQKAAPNFAAQITTTTPQIASSTSKFTNILIHDNIFVILIIFFGIGLLLTFTPCVLPLIPIVSSIVTGSQAITPLKSFKISLAYVLGMAVTYAGAGILAGYIGSNIQNALQTPWVIVTTALLFLLLALSMFGLYELRLPARLQEKVAALSNKQKGGSYIGAGVMGILSTLIVSTCVTAPLVGVLAFIGHTGNALLGGLVLFVMALGMGVPLLIVGVTNGSILPKSGSWMTQVKVISGILLLGLAIYMLAKVVSLEITLLLWSALIISIAIYLGALHFGIKNGWGKFRQSVGVVGLIYGIALMLGALSGHTNPLQPLSGFGPATTAKAMTKEPVTFVKVKSVADLNKRLAQARAQHKPVLLDYYAAWCADCQYMKHFTFTDPRVIKALKHFVVLQANVTRDTAANAALEKKYHIFGPPNIILYNANGNMVANLVGKIDATPLYNKLKPLS